MTATQILIPSASYGGHDYGDCRLSIEQYAVDGSPALILETVDGSTVATVTVNVSGHGMMRSEAAAFFIKDYSENTGIAAMLEDRGIIEATGGMAGLPFGQRVAEYQLAGSHASLIPTQDL